jgi:hypothetical protein
VVAGAGVAAVVAVTLAAWALTTTARAAMPPHTATALSVTTVAPHVSQAGQHPADHLSSSGLGSTSGTLSPPSDRW